MGRPALYPFADLEVGQCFTIPLDRASRGTVNALCYQWRVKLGRSFSYRTTDAGYVVERVEPKPAQTYAISAASPRRTRAQAQAEVDALACKMRDA